MDNPLNQNRIYRVINVQQAPLLLLIFKDPKDTQ